MPYNQDLEVEPALATSWELVEPTRLRFTLQDGVSFHNGNPFTADDVVASLERAAHETSPVKNNIPGMKSVEKVDDHTVNLVLTGPDPIVPNNLTNILILDREWMEEQDALMPTDMRGGRENLFRGQFKRHRPVQAGKPPAGCAHRADRQQDLVGRSRSQPDTHRVQPDRIRCDADRGPAVGELDFITPAPLQDVDRIDRSGNATVIVALALRTIMPGMNQTDSLHNSNLTEDNPM